jgi:hypothetical protein
MYGNLALLAGFVLVYSIVAGRMQRSLIGGAIAFTAFGLLFGPAGLGLLQLAVQSEGLRPLSNLRWRWCCSPMRRMSRSGWSKGFVRGE